TMAAPSPGRCSPPPAVLLLLLVLCDLGLVGSVLIARRPLVDSSRPRFVVAAAVRRAMHRGLVLGDLAGARLWRRTGLAGLAVHGRKRAILLGDLAWRGGGHRRVLLLVLVACVRNVHVEGHQRAARLAAMPAIAPGHLVERIPSVLDQLPAQCGQRAILHEE